MHQALQPAIPAALIFVFAGCAKDGGMDPGNSEPAVAIVAPANGTSVVEGTAITFTASATDPEDGDLGSEVTWSSNRDGPLGTGSSISPVLSAGAHTVRATVRDSDGAQATAAVDVSVTMDQAPTIAISSPQDGSAFNVGSAIAFMATAVDPEEGDITAAIIWSSSTDGAIGTGGSIQAILTAGTHSVTASVMDPKGQSASATVVVTVVAAGVEWVDISAGAHHTCAISTEQLGYCWGPGTDGQLGTGDQPASMAVPAAIVGPYLWSDIDAGAGFTCGITVNSSAYCWGLNLAGQLGSGSTGLNELLPVPVAGGMKWKAVTAGAVHTCGITTSGQAYCWGDNSLGKLGNGTFTGSAVPVAVSGGHEWKSLSAGGSVTCGVTIDDDAYCWGAGFAGQLGDGGRRTEPEPVQVAGGIEWSALSVGWSLHTCGLATNGDLYCWGEESAGQLGDGGSGVGQLYTPGIVSGGYHWSDIGTGRAHTCAVDVGGLARCWGERGPKLGDNHTNSQATPAAVSGSMNWTMISSAWNHTCGITNGGAAYCWGTEADGRLGNGNTTGESAAPSRVLDPGLPSPDRQTPGGRL